MLVLTRRPGQTIRIGEDIEIIVVEVRGDQVRLGIRAPRDVSILRGEILEEVQEANREAALSETDLLDALSGLAPLDENNPPEPENES